MKDKYHSDSFDAPPSLSRSVAQILLTQTPLHAWMAHPRLNPDFKEQHDDKFNIGTAAHAAFLEGLDVMQVCYFPDWRTKASQEAKAEAREAGKIPALPHQRDQIAAMVEAAKTALIESEYADTFREGSMPEHTICWTNGSAHLRSRLDLLSADCRTILDYKTTDVGAESWMRSIGKNGYDLQDAFYKAAVLSEYEQQARFVFMVQEVTEPYLCYFVELSEAYQELGRQKMSRAIRMWNECMKSNKWPGYPRRTMMAEPPAWEIAKAEEQIFDGVEWTVEGFLYGSVSPKEDWRGKKCG